MLFGKKDAKKPKTPEQTIKKGKLISTKYNILANIVITSFNDNEICGIGAEEEIVNFSHLKQVLFESDFEKEKGFYITDVGEIIGDSIKLVNLSPITEGEKRLFFRVGTSIDGYAMSPDKTESLIKIFDLSLGGMLMQNEGHMSFRLDDKFTFRCPDLNGDSFTCLVVRQDEEGKRFGCRFVDLNTRQEKTLSTFIAGVQRNSLANKVR